MNAKQWREMGMEAKFIYAMSNEGLLLINVATFIMKY